MEILINEAIPLDLWHKFLLNNPHASSFQSHEFYNLFNSIPGFTAKAIAIIRSDKILSLAVTTLQKEPGIKGYFSRRGIIYGGPLIDPEFPEALCILLQQISLSISKKCIYLETRNFTDYSKYKNCFQKHDWNYLPYLNFHVATKDKTIMESSISKSRMRQIKKAINSGVKWKEAANQDEVKAFYIILQSLYKTRINKPLLPWDFFREFYERNMGKYILVWFKGQIIGGILCPIFEKRNIFEFYICGLDNEFKNQYPSVMATWAAMEYANQNDIPLFDFMGAGHKDKDYGVREFKARFGGTMVEFGRFIKVQNRILYRLGKLALKVSKILK